MGKKKNLVGTETWYSGGFPPQMMLVISMKVLSKRRKENQVFKDTKFRKKC